MFNLTGYLIAIVIMGVQYFLSRRNNVYWGALIPAVYLIVFVYGRLSDTFFTKGTTATFLFATCGGLIILLGIWANGREFLKKKREKELLKMKSQDI